MLLGRLNKTVESYILSESQLPPCTLFLPSAGLGVAVVKLGYDWREMYDQLRTPVVLSLRRLV